VLDDAKIKMNKLETLKHLVNENSYAVAGLTTLAGLIFLSKRFYFEGGRCVSKARLDGKTAIITGSNTGIGKETALDLAKRGARVILACRDVDKANQAASEIRKRSGNGNVHVEKLDLASFDSIRSFASRINSQEARLDILINNAGIMLCPFWKTNDGFEMQFGVNHLGHFLLTNLLLDKLKQAPEQARIVNVSALAYESNKKPTRL
jgi:retinol dehydrogenase-12